MFINHCEEVSLKNSFDTNNTLVNCIPFAIHWNTKWASVQSRPRAQATKMLKSTIKFVNKFQYFFLASVTGLVLLQQVVRSVTKFNEQKTGTTDLYRSNADLAFPELTICSKEGYKTDIMLENGIKESVQYFFFGQWTSNDSLKSPEQLFEEIVFRLEDMIQKVWIYTEDLVQGENLIQLKPDEQFCGQDLFEDQFFYGKGKCYKLKAPSCIHKAGIVKIRLRFKTSLVIWVHYPGQFLSPNTNTKLHPDVSHFNHVFVSHELVHLLNISDQCVNEYLDFNGFDDCLYHSLSKLTMDNLNCSVPWVPQRLGGICNDTKIARQAILLYEQNFQNQRKLCPVSCKFANIQTGQATVQPAPEDMNALGEVHISFRKDVKLTQEYLLFSLDAMIGEIGGFVGLFLGYSLLSLSNVIGFFLDKIVHVLD